MACEGSGRRAGAQAGVSRARRGPGRLGSAELGSAPLRRGAGGDGRAGREARPRPGPPAAAGGKAESSAESAPGPCRFGVFYFFFR